MLSLNKGKTSTKLAQTKKIPAAKKAAGWVKPLVYLVLSMVGAAGFEPTTPSPPVKG